MLIELFLLSCLADAKPFEDELVQNLPGNNSSFHATECWADVGRANAVADWHLEQRTCVFGRCTSIYKYSGKAYGALEVNANCEVTSSKVWTVPSLSILDSVTEKAARKLEEKFQRIIAERPEYRQQMCPPN